MNIYQLQYIMNDEQQKFIIKRRISQMERSKTGIQNGGSPRKQQTKKKSRHFTLKTCVVSSFGQKRIAAK